MNYVFRIGYCSAIVMPIVNVLAAIFGLIGYYRTCLVFAVLSGIALAILLWCVAIEAFRVKKSTSMFDRD